MSDQSAEPVGAVLGHYRIERLLARGGFAAVYVATDTRPQIARTVALKVLNQALAADPTFRERFLRESLLAVGLDHHPSIVPVYDAGEDDGRLYIAMRFIDGTDLKAAIEEPGGLSPEYTASVASQIAGALDVAHAAGIVHRDVKPANVLLSADRQRAYLADFGLTKKLDADQALTATPGYMGTTFYSPPEQFEGGAVGPTADVYALGAVVFHCLTGQPPFPGTPESVIGAHLTKPVPRVTGQRPDLPRGVDEVIARAMAKDPKDRYQSAGALAAALSRAVVPGDQTFHDHPGAGAAGLAGAAAGAAAASTAPGGDEGATVAGAPPQSTPPPPPPGSPGPASYGSGPPSFPPPGAQPWADPSSSGGGGGPKKSKKGLVAALVAVLVLVVAGVVVALVLAGGGDETADPAPNTDEAEQPAEFPDEAESQLLETLPSEMRDSCERDDRTRDEMDGAQAAVSCELSNEDASQVALVSFEEPRQLSDAFETRVEESPEDLTSDNDCKFADDVTHSFENDAGGGEVACFFGAGNDAFMVWTVDDELVLGSTSRDDDDSATLYEWWKDIVGRTNEPPALTNPSPQEQALLDRLPAEYVDTCQRGRTDAANAFEGELAVVQCFPADQPGVSSVFYYAFTDVPQMNAAYDQLVTDAGVPRDTGTDCPREGTYDTGDGAVAGRNVCGVFEGEAFLAWTTDSVSVLSELRSVDDQFTGIQSYWESADPNPVP